MYVQMPLSGSDVKHGLRFTSFCQLVYNRSHLYDFMTFLQRSTSLQRMSHICPLLLLLPGLHMSKDNDFVSRRKSRIFVPNTQHSFETRDHPREPLQTRSNHLHPYLLTKLQIPMFLKWRSRSLSVTVSVCESVSE